MLPPRYWPTRLWVATVAAGVLILHCVGLAVHLLLAAPGASSYAEHVITGFVPGLMALGVGLYASVPALRDDQDAISAWGRVFVLGFIAIALALLWLGLQVY